MIKRIKNKKLIMQVIAFLLMFTFIFGALPTYKSHAIPINEGDTVVVKMHTSPTCTYTIEAEFYAGAWNITNTDNQILCNGEKANLPAFWLSLVKSYCSETGSATAKGMVVKALEFYVDQTGNTITSDRVSGKDNNVILSKTDGKVEWGKAVVGGTYKSVLSNGNPGENGNALNANDMHINNPLHCSAVSQMDDAMKGLLVNGTPITAMNDVDWLTLILNSGSTPSWINITYNTKGGSISADVSGYYAKLVVPDEDKTSGNILIKVYDKNDKNVIDFKYGELTGKGKYREITYHSSSTSKVFVCGGHDDNNLYLSLVRGADANVSLFKTASGSTVDAYNSKLKIDNILNKAKEVECYTAVKDAALNMVYIYGAFEAKSTKAEFTLLCSVDLGYLEELLGQRAITAINGDWIFELVNERDSIVLAYKSEDPDPEANGWYFYLDELKNLRVDNKSYYDLMVPTKETKSGTKLSTQPSEPEKPFSVLRGMPRDKGDKVSLLQSKEALYSELLAGSPVYCSARSLKVKGKVGTNEKKLVIGQTYCDGNEPAGEDYPPEFAINDFLLVGEDVQKKLDGEADILDDIYAKLGDNKSEIKHNFVDDVLKYGKIIIMFLFLLAVCYTAILSIQSSGDIKKRVLIKERIKDIMIGMIIFACVIPIFNLVASFVNESYQSLGEFTGEFSGPTYYATITRFKVGYIVKFIGKIIDAITLGINWLIDAVLAYSMTPGDTRNLMQLIYVATEDNGLVSSLLPFTLEEWTVYTMGYRLLTAVFMAFICIALVKVSIEYMINAGNVNKIEECKESFKRIFLSILMVVLAPYGFRLLLLFFNYMTSMLPVDGATAVFDIDFQSVGFVGSIANMLFATTRLKIFVLFFVRKVMLALMLISTPFVCGVWAVSNKFRSFNLWIGTILSNAAIQFCYALVFMVVILISYEGQNPFIKLIIVILIPKFASFFSQSLQGLGQVWGGINAEAEADNVVNYYKGLGRKGLNKVKKTGFTLQKAARKFDPKAISKTGRRVNNAGAILSGQFLNIRTKQETLENRAALAKADFKKDQKVLDNAFRNRKMALLGRSEGDKVFDYDKALSKGDYALANSLREDSAEYDIIDDYYDAKQAANLSGNLYEGLVARTQTLSIANQGYLGIGQAYINNKIDKNMYSEIDRLYDNLSSHVSRSREVSNGRKGSDESLSKILTKAEKAMSSKLGNGKQRTPEQINKSVDSVFNDLINYMEHAQNKETVQLEITDAIFAGLFAKKTESNGFTPEMAVKYQETKEQYFVDLDKAIVKAVEKTATAEEMKTSNVEVHASETTATTTTDNIAAGESMVSANAQKASAAEASKDAEPVVEKPKKEQPKKSDSDVGAPMFGAGEKITPGAGGSVTAEAGGKAFNDDFKIGNETSTGFDVSTETYASEHGAEGEGSKSDGAPTKEPEAKPQPPTKKDSLNYGQIGDQSKEKKIELIKHHDSSYGYDTLEDKLRREEADPSKRDFDEKELLDEDRLKSIAKLVEEMSSEDPTADADEVVKKAIEQFVEKEEEKNRKIDHQPTLRHPDFNGKPRQ